MLSESWLPRVQSFVHSFIHSFIHSFVHSFIRSFIHSGDLYSASSRHYHSEALPSPGASIPSEAMMHFPIKYIFFISYLFTLFQYISPYFAKIITSPYFSKCPPLIS